MDEDEDENPTCPLVVQQKLSPDGFDGGRMHGRQAETHWSLSPEVYEVKIAYLQILPVQPQGRCTSASLCFVSVPSLPLRPPSCSPSWQQACQGASSLGPSHGRCSSRGRQLSHHRTGRKPLSSAKKKGIIWPSNLGKEPLGFPA